MNWDGIGRFLSGFGKSKTETYLEGEIAHLRDQLKSRDAQVDRLETALLTLRRVAPVTPSSATPARPVADLNLNPMAPGDTKPGKKPRQSFANIREDWAKRERTRLSREDGEQSIDQILREKEKASITDTLKLATKEY